MALPVESGQLPMSGRPAQTDSRIPLAVGPAPDVNLPAPVDMQANQARSYGIQQIAGAAKAQVGDQKDAERDKASIQAYLASGGKGNLATPEGMNQILQSDWAKKNLSQKGYQNLSDIYGKKVAADLTIKQALADEDPTSIANIHDTMEAQARYVTAPPLEAYDSALAAGEGEKAALDAFTTARTRSAQFAQNMKDKYGKPLFTPEKIQKMQTMGPDEFRYIYQNSDYYMARMKAALEAKLAGVKVAESGARIGSLNAQAEKFKAEANRDRSQANKVTEKNMLVDGVEKVVLFDPIKKSFMDANTGEDITSKVKPIPSKGSGGGLGVRGSIYFQRVTSAANEAVASLKNIAELPITTSTGMFGTAKPGGTLLGSSISVLSNAMTTQDVQDYKATAAGIQRTLSAIESAGLSPPGSLTEQMDKITYHAGDSNLTKLRKLAETRQIVEKGLEPYLHNPQLSQEQKDYVTQLIGDVSTAVPYTVHDINEFQKAGRKNSQLTPNDFFSAHPLKNSASTAKPEVLPTLPDPSKYTGQTATDNDTGEVFKSDGKNWVRQGGPTKPGVTGITLTPAEQAIKTDLQSGKITEAEAVQKLNALGHP